MKTLLIFPMLLIFSMLHSQSAVLHLNDAAVDFTAETSHDHSFTLNRGIVLVDVKVNGQTGTYILDTGAPSIVLNEKLTASAPAAAPTSGLHAPTPAEAVTVATLEWQGETRTDLPGLRIDLEHLEQKTATPLGGLIGYELLRDRELELDYPNRRVRVGRTTQRRAETEFSLPFQLVGHVPVLRLKHKGKTYHFLLDTGASINLLDERSAVELGDVFVRSARTKTLYGVDKQPLRTRTGSLQALKLKRHRTTEIMPVHLADLTRLRAQFEHPIDGILGYPFLRDRHLVVDYRRRRVLFLAAELRDIR